MANKVYVIGVGMTKFEKPGRARAGTTRTWPASRAPRRSQDAGIDYDEVEQGYVGYVYGESTSGQRALYELGHDRHPDRQRQQQLLDRFDRAVPRRAGDPRRPGRLRHRAGLREDEARLARHRPTTTVRSRWSKHILAMAEISEVLFPPAPWMFGAAGREHMEQYGTTAEHFAKIGFKNHKHSVNNPYAQFQEEYTLEDILGVADDLRPADQAAVLAHLGRIGRGDPRQRSVRRPARLGGPGGGDRRSGHDHRLRLDLRRHLQGADRLRHERPGGATGLRAVRARARRTSRSSSCTTASRPTSCCCTRRSGCAARARRAKLIDNGDTTYGGRWVVNPSGGLISKGHPLGATGLAQCAELTWQLRGTADKRQVDNVTAALQHNIGLGGAAVVTAYQRAER